MPNRFAHLVRRIAGLSTTQLIGLATLADLLAGALYWLYTRDVLESRFFRLARDRGFAEIVQYLKFGLMIYLLATARPGRTPRLFRAWIVLFAVMLADDAIGIHEALGELFVGLIPHAALVSLRAKDLAEAGSFALLEGSLFLYVLLCQVRAPPDQRTVSLWLMAAMVPLVLSGIVLDIVHVPLTEEVGEMVSMSLLLAAVHYHCRRATPADTGTATGKHARCDSP